jgi:hypothetical protein
MGSKVSKVLGNREFTEWFVKEEVRGRLGARALGYTRPYSLVPMARYRKD